MRQLLEGWGRDLTQAARSLLRAPGFTAVTIATLALAIGSNAAIFSVINTVLLEPLAFPEPDRLVSIRASAPGSDLPEEFGVAPEFWIHYRENASGLEEAGMYRTGQTTVRADDEVERLFVTLATPSLFGALGVTPRLGRLFTEDDEGDVVVISHWLWTTWFGEDPEVLGRSLEVSGTPRTVIGVMGPEFGFPEDRIAVWGHGRLGDSITPGQFGFNLVGRMTPGTDHASLATQLAALARELPERFGGSPEYHGIIERHRPVVRSLEEELVGDMEGPLWILLGTVGIVLLVACANVANLLLVRAEGRRRDLAVRRALGGSRAGLIRTQMAEAFVLAAAGGAGGVFLAWIGVPVLVQAAPESIPRLGSVGVNPTVLLFTAGLVILAACAAGLLPAIRFSKPGLAGGLRDAGRIGSGPDHRLRDALVVLQTGSAVVLLVASGLLLQSFRTLHRVDPGYDTEDIFTFQMAPDPREHGLTDALTLARFHITFMERLAALPGVESVGLVNTLPLDEGAGTARFASEETSAGDVGQPRLRYTYVGGDYFQTMGIELLSGRLLEQSDRIPGEVEAVVSRSAAAQLWRERDPVGRRLRMASDTSGNWVRVVGVVEDILLSDFRQERPDPMVYLPMVGPSERAWAVGTPAYVVKTGRAETIAPEVRELVREVAPSAPMYRVFTMAGLAARSVDRLTFTMLTLAVAAGLALVLGAVGLYGVLSYVVSQRTREIGVRMALGARARQVRRLVVAQGGRLTLLGVGVGVVAAAGLMRVLESLLFGVGATHVPTFAAMAALMLLVGLLASYMPARRASSVDPIHSLRAE